MNATGVGIGTLAGRLIGREGFRGLVGRLILAAAGAVLLTIAAKIKFPFYPVPMTLQTLAVFFIGATLGARFASISVLIYLFEGLIGLPVFTNTPPAVAGPAYFAGPTGGYLLGFWLAAILIGAAARRGFDRSTLRFALVLVIADAVLFACGVIWLSAVSGLGMERAIAVGLTPFIAGEAVKIALAACAMPMIWRLAARRG